MEEQMEQISKLVSDRNEAKMIIREAENELAHQLWNLPNEVKLAIALEIVKPAFPVPYRMLSELKSDMLNNY